MDRQPIDSLSLHGRMDEDVSKMPIIEQAGAVVFRNDGELRILVVTSRKEPSHWIFPKGHIESEESSDAAALREAVEEAGAVGDIVGELAPILEYRLGEKEYRVRYYLVQLKEEIPSDEPRQKAWLSSTEAMQRLTHQTARDLLKHGLDIIRSLKQ
jgi:8-oxo-dGTP pyrophosphatase MutT (NUDIX family)